MASYIINEMVHHSHHTFTVGSYRADLLFQIQLAVLVTDSGSVQEQVRRSSLFQKHLQCLDGILTGDIHCGNKYFIHTVLRTECLQSFCPASGNANLPTVLDEADCYFPADAGGGSYDDGCFHNSIIWGLISVS